MKRLLAMAALVCVLSACSPDEGDAVAAPPIAAPPAPAAGSSATPAGLRLFQLDVDTWSLCLPTGTTPVDDTAFALGHTPNGPFWDGVAAHLVEQSAPELAPGIFYNSEAGAFCAESAHVATLRALQDLLTPAVTDPAALRAIVADPGFSSVE